MMIFHVLKSENADNFDLIWGSFYMCGNGPLTKTTEYNNVFVHNKYYRTSFLKEHGIRFCEYLHMSEDSAFNTLIKLEIGPNRIGQINSDEPLYAWCRRPGSITMDMTKWIYNTEGHFERNLYVLNEYSKHGLTDINLMIARTITDAYAMLNRKDGIDNNPGRKHQLESRIADFYLENKELFESVSPKLLQTALNASDKDACTHKNDILTRPSLSDWLKTIVSQKNQPLK
jgi:hypothetical protein